VTLLSPSATFHAELREQLSGVGRALSYQRAIVWLARGLVLGAVGVLALVVWAWTREAVSLQSLPMFGVVLLGVALAVGALSLFLRHDNRDLARRVDLAARLNERSITALELGGRGEEFPLALAQMRDALEHLRRVDLLEAFPMQLPKRELMATFFILAVATIIGISPNPWLLRQRASNPAISIAREQAQRVERLAESIRAEDSPELDPLRELLRKGARTIDARSNEPGDALNALEDLEEQVQQLSAGDDQLAAALAAIASALATDPATQNLANAINTGDLREISRAARDLGQQTEQMTGQERERVARVLRDSSNRAGRASPSVAGELADAAAAMEGGEAGESADGAMGNEQDMQSGSGRQQGASPNGRSARDALNELSNNAAAAAERQRAASQLESSRNALERSLGRTQSRSGSGSTGRSSSSSSQRSQAGAGSPDRGESGAQGQGSEMGEGGEQSSGGGMPGENDGSGESGEGGGFSSGGQNQNRTGVSGLDTITRPEQVPNGGLFTPDESMQNPYLGDAAEGAANAGDESVAPSFSRKPTTGNDSGSIPLGLRDLVKDYFTSLDQK
jgi:hypothetical protein